MGKPYAKLVPLEGHQERRPSLATGRLTDAFFEPLPEDELAVWEQCGSCSTRTLVVHPGARAGVFGRLARSRHHWYVESVRSVPEKLSARVKHARSIFPCICYPGPSLTRFPFRLSPSAASNSSIASEHPRASAPLARPSRRNPSPEETPRSAVWIAATECRFARSQ